jgi:hypothetical protein
MAEEALIVRVKAVNNHIKELDAQGLTPADDPDPAFHDELKSIGAESNRVTAMRRQALAKARGEKETP